VAAPAAAAPGNVHRAVYCSSWFDSKICCCKHAAPREVWPREADADELPSTPEAPRRQALFAAWACGEVLLAALTTFRVAPPRSAWSSSC
jgi:hypothetical protein